MESFASLCMYKNHIGKEKNSFRTVVERLPGPTPGKPQTPDANQKFPKLFTALPTQKIRFWIEIKMLSTLGCELLTAIPCSWKLVMTNHKHLICLPHSWQNWSSYSTSQRWVLVNKIRDPSNITTLNGSSDEGFKPMAVDMLSFDAKCSFTHQLYWFLVSMQSYMQSLFGHFTLVDSWTVKAIKQEFILSPSD